MSRSPIICSCGPDDSQGCPVCRPEGAVGRVREFSRQRHLGVVRRGGLDGELISSVHIDDDADMAYLFVADLDEIVRLAEGRS